MYEAAGNYKLGAILKVALALSTCENNSIKRMDPIFPNWEEATLRIDDDRRHRLPLIDTDLAIQRFARSWKIARKNYLPRLTSGLIEQQALFRKLEKLPE